MRDKLSKVIQKLDQNIYPFPDLREIDLQSSSSNKFRNSEETILRVKPITIKFSDAQRNRVEKWFELYRQVYNLTVKYVNKTKASSYYSVRKEMKKNIIPAGLQKSRKYYRMPVHTLDNAINDVLKAKNSAIQNLKAGNIKHFRLRPKKINKNKQCIVIEASAFHSDYNTFAPLSLGWKIETSESIAGINRDCRLIWNKRSKNPFTLFVPTNTFVKKLSNGRRPVCSLDPGVRTFQTCYDKSSYFKIGEGITHRIEPLLERIEEKNTPENRQQKWFKKYSSRLYSRIGNIIKDLHWKAALFLCTRYKKIYIGDMSTKSITSKRGRLVSKIRMLTILLSHYTFRQRLISKAEQYSTEIQVVNEAYTSKTCGSCGKINDKLGSNKVFNCDCGLACDRDLNGARNIMIKKK